MNIIFNTEDLDNIKNNNILFELDTFYFPKLNQTRTAYCVIENLKINDFVKILHIQQTHCELMDAYKNKHFEKCIQLAESLENSLDGELDSFYQEIKNRAQQLNQTILPDDWTGIILKND